VPVGRPGKTFLTPSPKNRTLATVNNQTDINAARLQSAERPSDLFGRQKTMSTIESEIAKLRNITNICRGLVDYTRSLRPGEFQLEGNRWVFRPDNFVTMSIHCTRANNLSLSLRGAPSEYDQSDKLPLKSGMGHVYAECKIERPDQLDVAAYHIRRALTLYLRGRERPHTKEKRIEQ
jgi:hypothetical protein